MAAARLYQPRQQAQKIGRRGLKRPTFSLRLAAKDTANTGHNHRLMNVKTSDAFKHYIHMILLDASAAGVGTSLKENSRQHAPGASLLPGQSGVIEVPWNQTKKRVRQHHGKTDLFADGQLLYRLNRSRKSFIQGGRPKAGGELKRNNKQRLKVLISLELSSEVSPLPEERALRCASRRMAARPMVRGATQERGASP
jgi:hypothetical protein